MKPTMSFAELLPALPEIYLTIAICVVLLVDAFAGRASRRITPTLTLLVIAVGAALTLAFAPPWSRVLVFSDMYVSDALATFLKLVAMLFVAVALLYSRAYVEAKGILKGEYYVLVLTALLGIFVMSSAASLLTMYIGIELLALSLYALVAFDRDSGVAAESAMKYFVLGAIASGCLLYGMSLLYGLSGSLLLHEISAAFSGEPSLGLIMGVVFVVVGIAFKFGAVPFHMWVPDVYQGAPASVTLFVATAPKLASFALAFRLLAEGLGNSTEVWTQMLAIVAVLSLLLGNVVALAQSNVKRLLGYSAIGNVGFILLGFVAASESGYAAALFYTVAYVLTSLAAFGVLVLASQRGFEAEEFEHFKGLHARDPFLALMMMVAMFSVAGIPLFVGFWAKLEIFAALWASDHLVLIVIAALASVVGVAYSLRVIKLMYFDAPGEFPAPVRQVGVRAALALNAIAIVLLGVLPNSLLQVCKNLLS